MPKSKRNRIVHLTKTEARGRGRKQELIDNVQKCCDEYKMIYVFSCENMRSDPLKRLRSAMKSSRFMFGKNKVIKLAMGKSKEEAYLPGLDKLAQVLNGEVGLIFTNEKPSEFEKQISEFVEWDYARSGFVATKDVVRPQGPIEGHPSSMFEPLRKMMLPVKLNKGIIELEEDHYVCKKGDVLSPEQAQALKFFDEKLAKFQISLGYRFRDGALIELEGLNKFQSVSMMLDGDEDDKEDEEDWDAQDLADLKRLEELNGGKKEKKEEEEEDDGDEEMTTRRRSTRRSTRKKKK